jgi:membrane protein
MAQAAAARRKAKSGIRAFVDLWVGCFAKHNLLTWASAIAFQVLVALVPLTVLALGILGALDERRVWIKQISPGIHKRLPPATWHAVNYAAELILAHATAGLLVFGAALTIWEISGSVRAIMGALNRVYDTNEDRPAWRRFGISFAIAVAIVVCVIGAVLVVTLASHLGGSLHVVVDVGRWILVVALLSIAVEVLVRFAPAERRAKKWVTLGSAFTVIAWVVATLIFRTYVESVANFRSTFGTFVAVLILTGYLYTTAIIFLVGVQADELIRKDATRGKGGPLDHVRAALGAG